MVFISVDGAYRNTALAIFDVDDETNEFTISFQFINLEHEIKAGIGMAIDIKLLSDIYKKAELTYNPDFWIYELPKGAKSARAISGMFVAYATFINSVPEEKVRYIPNNMRKGLALSNDKNAVISYVRENYPNVPLSKLKKIAEHQADAFLNGLLFTGL